MRTKFSQIGILVIASIFILATRLYASQIIYDNGGPLLPCNTGPCGFIADVSLGTVGQEVADDFTLNAGRNTITDVHWWGAYVPSDTPTTPDNFTIRFYQDNGGLPQATAFLALNVGDVGRVATGDKTFSTLANRLVNLYAFSTVIEPLTLNPNTPYWLSIQNDLAKDPDDVWGWTVSKLGSGNMAARFGTGPWATETLFRPELAFNLTAVPEPATLLLMGSGLLGLSALRKFRK